jgi:hypothetical protein
MWSPETEPALPRPDRVCLAPCRGTCHTRGLAASPCLHPDLLSMLGAGDAYRVLTPIAARVPMPTTPCAPLLKKAVYL